MCIVISKDRWIRKYPKCLQKCHHFHIVLLQGPRGKEAIQAEEIELATVITLLESLSSFRISVGSKFDEFERRAIDVAHIKTYKDVNQLKRRQTAPH